MRRNKVKYNIFIQKNKIYSDDRLTPSVILREVESVYAGYYLSVAIKKDKSYWAFGDNTYNQIDSSTDNLILKPRKINWLK